jgi:hypothetical protein
MGQEWRTVRVFISSTFRDMHAERDHLVRFVFPRLREELLQRRIRLAQPSTIYNAESDMNAVRKPIQQNGAEQGLGILLYCH